MYEHRSKEKKIKHLMLLDITAILHRWEFYAKHSNKSDV